MLESTWGAFDVASGLAEGSGRSESSGVGLASWASSGWSVDSLGNLGGLGVYSSGGGNSEIGAGGSESSEMLSGF